MGIFKEKNVLSCGTKKGIKVMKSKGNAGRDTIREVIKQKKESVYDILAYMSALFNLLWETCSA